FNGQTATGLSSTINSSTLFSVLNGLTGFSGKIVSVTGAGTAANPFLITFASSLGSVDGSADGSSLIGTDGFFVLNTMGVASAPQPGATTWTIPAGLTDDDTVDASASTLPLIIFGGYGYDNIIGGQGQDIIVGDFGRVQTTDQN